MIFKLNHFLKTPFEVLLSNLLGKCNFKIPENMFHKDKKIKYKTYVLEFLKPHFLNKLFTHIYTCLYS